MNGKDYVMEAIGIAETVLSGCEASGKLSGNELLEKLTAACGDLGEIKNKPSLRTRDGSDKAYPVHETVKRMEEDWEDAAEGDDTAEIEESMEEFVGAVETLVNALKSKTVVMT